MARHTVQIHGTRPRQPTAEDPSTLERHLIATYLLRVPDVPDLWRVNEQLPLDAKLSRDAARIRESEDDPCPECARDRGHEDGCRAGALERRSAQQSIAFANRLLPIVSIKPRILEETVDPVPAGCVCVEEIPYGHRLQIVEELLAKCGFARLVDGSLGNCSGTDEASNGSTPSVTATGRSPETSSGPGSTPSSAS